MTAAPEALEPPAARRPRKAFVRRLGDDTQRIRRAVQAVFLVLNVWIGVEFYLFVRHHETAGQGMAVARPAGVEGWLPIASLMNLKYWVVTGEIPAAHPAGMFLLASFLAISLLFRKAFCGWLCPVGTVSEYLWRIGRHWFGRNFSLPRWADLPLRSLKYVLLGLFLWAVATMSAPAIRAFLDGPYGVVADVKMLNFFRFMSVTTAVVLGLLILVSFFVQNFWCRYLCPYGALMGLVALASPSRIRRDAVACIDCGKCARACPSRLPVDQLVTIRSAECLGCLECVASCPVEGALHMKAAGRRVVPAWAMAAGIMVLFVGVWALASATGHWDTEVPRYVYRELIPRANEFGHP